MRTGRRERPTHSGRKRPGENNAGAEQSRPFPSAAPPHPRGHPHSFKPQTQIFSAHKHEVTLRLTSNARLPAFPTSFCEEPQIPREPSHGTGGAYRPSGAGCLPAVSSSKRRSRSLPSSEATIMHTAPAEPGLPTHALFYFSCMMPHPRLESLRFPTLSGQTTQTWLFFSVQAARDGGGGGGGGTVIFCPGHLMAAGATAMKQRPLPGVCGHVLCRRQKRRASPQLSSPNRPLPLPFCQRHLKIANLPDRSFAGFPGSFQHSGSRWHESKQDRRKGRITKPSG